MIQFRDDEIVTRKQKVEGVWVTRLFPVVGGRLRLAHEGNKSLSIKTEVINEDFDAVVARATVESEKGTYSGTATATKKRDSRLANTLVELAETRAIARALRFAGYGVEYCSAEEVDHIDSDLSVLPEESPDAQPKPTTVEDLINKIPAVLESRGVPENMAAEATEAAGYMIKDKFGVIKLDEIGEGSLEELRGFMNGEMIERLEKYYAAGKE